MAACRPTGAPRKKANDYREKAEGKGVRYEYLLVAVGARREPRALVEGRYSWTRVAEITEKLYERLV